MKRWKIHLPAAALAALAVVCTVHRDAPEAGPASASGKRTSRHLARKSLREEGRQRLLRLARGGSGLPGIVGLFNELGRDGDGAFPGSSYSGPQWDAIPEEARRAFLAKWDAPVAPVGGAGKKAPPPGNAAAQANEEEAQHECPADLLKTSPPASAGALPYSFKVGHDGSAHVAIPLKVPPGVRGMEPKLGLVYSSNAGISEVGKGWSLAGKSAIRRIRKNWAVDGALRPVRGDENDTLALDGNPLVPVGGGRYRTLVDEFARIEEIDGDGGRNGFRVWTRDGLIKTYGAGDNSRFGRLGDVWHTYALAIFDDRFGNSIAYRYRRDEAGGLPALLEEVTFAGGRIACEYVEGGRPDEVVGYRDGVPWHLKARLAEIKVFAPPLPEPVRTYILENAEADDSGHLLLKSLKESAGGVDSPPLVFDYTRSNGLPHPANPPFNLTQEFFARFAVQGGRGPENWFRIPHGAIAADLDGDGKDEIVYRESLNLWFRSWTPSRTGLIGRVEGPWWTILAEYARQAGPYRPQSLNNTGGERDHLLVPMELGDKYEMYIMHPDLPRPSPTGVEVSQVDQFLLTPTLVDINGDGRKDLVQIDSEGELSFRFWNDNGFSGPHRIQGFRIVPLRWGLRRFVQFMDVDGDGAQDLVYVPQDGFRRENAFWIRYMDAYEGGGRPDVGRILPREIENGPAGRTTYGVLLRRRHRPVAEHDRRAGGRRTRTHRPIRRTRSIRQRDLDPVGARCWREA